MDDLEFRLAREVERGHAPGVSVAWAFGEGPVKGCSVGEARKLPSCEMSIRTVLPWFSVTKLFTATAALRLVETQKLDLDARVSSFRPDLFDDAIGGLTPRQLLSHTSGLANPMPLRWVHPASEPGPTLESMTRRLLSSHGRLRFEPGTRYAYSNLGYLVLGLLIEAVGGLDFGAFVARNILGPLGADATGFELPPNAARGHIRAWSIMGLAARLLVERKLLGARHGGFRELRPFEVDGAPYGGLVGPVTDMLTLGRAMLTDGWGADGRVLEASSVRLALTPIRLRDGSAIPMGLGWHLGEASGEPYANHIGGGLGFRSELRIYPRLGCAVAVIANETSFDTSAFAEAIAPESTIT